MDLPSIPSCNFADALADSRRDMVGSLVRLISQADRLGETKLAFLLEMALAEARGIGKRSTRG